MAEMYFKLGTIVSNIVESAIIKTQSYTTTLALTRTFCSHATDIFSHLACYVIRANVGGIILSIMIISVMAIRQEQASCRANNNTSTNDTTTPHIPTHANPF